jgi:hypothetical protein
MNYFTDELRCFYIGGDGKIAAKRREQGFEMISIGVDIDSLGAAFSEHMAAARGPGRTGDYTKKY